ncbi:MAG: hypothetical protein K0S74_28 [Chlamydiales bacterium]|jgi:3-dehydroquinate dehydratase/shikimate dehydrogenase|nr:hypothetical protein [Chlamydiales bacterium]
MNLFKSSICVPIIGPTSAAIEQQMILAVAKGDIIEWRIDRFDDLSFADLPRFIPKNHPLLITALPACFHRLFESPLSEILQENVVKWVDFPWEANCNSVIERFRSLYPHIQILISHHNFEQTPDHLEKLFQTLFDNQASVAKLATFSNSTLDSLRMLQAVRSYSHERQIIGVCMGELGPITRILAPRFGDIWTYAALSPQHQSAPGQTPIDELIEIYRYRQLSSKTTMLGLIGNPVDKSPSHLTHNHVFDKLNLDAVYVKMALKDFELPDFLKLSKELGFRGFSVTMPFKQRIIPYLDRIAPCSQAIGSINTLHITSNELVGYNTDGKAAIRCLEKQISLAGKRAIILGNGGTARAIAYELQRNGVQVILLGRDLVKLQTVATDIKCQIGLLKDLARYLKNPVDIIIQATPVGMSPDVNHSLIDLNDLSSKHLVMDVVSNPRETKLLAGAKSKGCTIITGLELFMEQALLQFKIWFGDSIDLLNARKQMELDLTS